MLVLKTRIGQVIRLFDKDRNIELGQISRLKPHSTPHEVLLGFDLSPNIQILRDSLLNGKETSNDQKQR